MKHILRSSSAALSSPSSLRWPACWPSAPRRRRSGSTSLGDAVPAPSISAICRRPETLPVQPRLADHLPRLAGERGCRRPALVVIAIHGSSALERQPAPARQGAERARHHRFTPRTSAATAAPACAATSTTPASSTTTWPILSPWCARDHPNAKLVLMGFSSGGGYALHVAAPPLGKTFERAVLLSPMLGPFAPTYQHDAKLRQAFHPADLRARRPRSHRHSRLRSSDHAPPRHRPGADRHPGRPLFLAADARLRNGRLRRRCARHADAAGDRRRRKG